MSIFKKLFGVSSKASKKPDIEKLLTSDDVNAIIELDTYICELCNYGEEHEKLTEQQRNFFFNQSLEREINNGGFNQYFSNSSGDFAHETVKSLRIVGANNTADVLQKAINQFPKAKVPTDREERQEIIEQIEEKANAVWEKLDEKFCTYEDKLNDLNIEYVRQNKNYF